MNTLIHNLIHGYQISEDKNASFNSLNSFHKALLLYSLEDKYKIQIINDLNDSKLIEIFKFLDPDEITDIIQIMPRSRQRRILLKLDDKHKEKINFLLKFASDSAAGLMSLNYLIVTNNDSKETILHRLERHMALGKKEPNILVVNDDDKFIGEIRITNLLFKNKHNIYSNLKTLPTVIYNEDQEEVIDIFRRNRHERVVVLDVDNSILGIIHAKDVFKVIDEEDTEDLYGIAGLDKQEDITDSAFEKVKFRLNWLIINLATAFLAAWVVTLFETTISKYVLLAAFMPIIAGMGGNAGTQTTAILIRSLALKKIDSSLTKKILFSETFAAIINGVVIGIIIAVIAYFFNSDVLFGLVAGIAVIANLIVAAVFGTIIPLILKSLNYDPAASSTVFVTTATDVFGFFIFLGLANLFLI